MLGICTYINLFNSHKNHRGKTISPCFQIEGSATQILFNRWMKDKAFKF